MNKIVIVGSGSIARRHLAAIRKVFPKCEVMILRRFKNEKTIPHVEHIVYAVEDALKFIPDMAIIATPASEHIKIAKAFAHDGIPLLIEKPLSNNTEGVLEFLKYCKENSIFVRVGYNLRCLDSLQNFREMCLKKVLGSIVSIHSTVGQYLPDWRPDQDYKNGVSAQARLGGGALLELSHEIDYILWIFGDIEWVRSTHAKKSDLLLDVEDSVHMVIGIEQKSSDVVLIGTLNLDFVRRDRIRECVVICQSGSLKWNGDANTISIYDSKKSKWKTVYKGKVSIIESYAVQLKTFKQDLLKFREKEEMDLYGLQVLEVIEASRSSAPSGAQKQVRRAGLGR